MEIKNTVVITLSKLISNIFNPLVSLLIYFFYYSVRNYTLKEATAKFLPILLVLILPTAIFIYTKVRRGKFTNMDVSNRSQRHSLYIFLIIAMAVYIGVDYYIHRRTDLAILMLLVLLVLMQISNFFIKSSMHTALNIYVAALFFAISPAFGILWFILAVIVGITRIILKRHQPSEVFSGAAIAVVVSLGYLAMAENFPL